jgi:hypothetical protein
VVSIETIVIAPDPTVDLDVSDLQVVEGAIVTLTWTSTDATGCIGSWTSSPLATSGSDDVTVNETTTYTITCTNMVGSAQESHMVTVLPEMVFSSGFESNE